MVRRAQVNQTRGQIGLVWNRAESLAGILRLCVKRMINPESNAGTPGGLNKRAPEPHTPLITTNHRWGWDLQARGQRAHRRWAFEISARHPTTPSLVPADEVLRIIAATGIPGRGAESAGTVLRGATREVQDNEDSAVPGVDDATNIGRRGSIPPDLEPTGASLCGDLCIQAHGLLQ